MLADPSGHVCVRISGLFAVESAQPVVGFIKKGFHGVSFDGKCTNNGYRKIVAAFRAHSS